MIIGVVIIKVAMLVSLAAYQILRLSRKRVFLAYIVVCAVSMRRILVRLFLVSGIGTLASAPAGGLL